MSGEHAFDAAIALEPLAGDDFRGRTSPAYANFIGPYGGVTAAQVLQAVLVHPQRLGEPIALTVNYAAALTDGEFTVRARPARTNRSTQHWIVEVLQNGETVITATCMTAARRATWSGHEVVMPQVPRAADVPRTPRRGVEWLNRYDMRFFEGSVPRQWEGQGGPESLTRLWVREDPERTLDFPALAAMSDIFFPRIWLRRATQTPIGTVTMTAYFHADGAQLAATGTSYLLAQAKGQGFRNGYFDHAGHLWNEAGELLVSTHQVVYFKE
jgi:acyl-CoA thioesterase